MRPDNGPRSNCRSPSGQLSLASNTTYSASGAIQCLGQPAFGKHDVRADAGNTHPPKFARIMADATGQFECGMRASANRPPAGRARPDRSDRSSDGRSNPPPGRSAAAPSPRAGDLTAPFHQFAQFIEIGRRPGPPWVLIGQQRHQRPVRIAGIECDQRQRDQILRFRCADRGSRPPPASVRTAHRSANGACRDTVCVRSAVNAMYDAASATFRAGRLLPARYRGTA